MRKLSYFLAVGILTATTVFVGCKKKKDPTPDAAPDAPVVTSTMTTTNGGNSGTALASLSVTTSTGTAKIRLDVTSGAADLDKIYIMKSEDNGALVAQSVASITTSDGKTFSGGSASYSLTVPSSTQSFVIDIPVSIRTTASAVSDVYYVWITNGTGDFLKPTKKTVLGPAVITLNYTAVTVTPYSIGSVTLGDQFATPGSLLVTSGQISALGTADYVDAPGSADIALGDLNVAATTRTPSPGPGTGNLYFFSPSLRPSLGYAGCGTCGAGGTALTEPTTGNLTYIALYTGSVTFDNATGTDLAGLSVGTGTKVQVQANAVYMFQTAKGKKGLLKVTSTTAGTAGNGTAAVSVKVQN
jgi:hypothetical protein